jgi:hypothetical protein
MSLYQSGFTQVASEGIDANATATNRIGDAEASFGGIIAISLGLLVLGAAFLTMLERRWGRSAFEN